MKGYLERRLQVLETRWFGSPKIAAYHRAIRAMSDEELDRAIAEAESGRGVLRTYFQDFNDAEGARIWKDHERARKAHRLP